MQRYLIEIPHEETKDACDKAVKILTSSGSHFLTHADLGCHGGVHKAWLIVEVENKKDAERIVPPYYRDSALVVQLQRLNLENIDSSFKPHHE